MRRFLLLFLITCSVNVFASSPTDSLFDQLNVELAKKSVYDQAKEASIQKFKKALRHTPKGNYNAQFNICSQLYNEYKSYQYDSAYVYAIKLQELSHVLHDKSKEDYSKIKIGFILLSSGMFKETFDNLFGINLRSLDDSVKIEYYSMLTRAYYDLANYDNDHHYSPFYNSQANKYIDSAIALSKPGSYDKIYLSGYKKLKNGNFESAIVDFDTLLNQHTLTVHQYAIVSSTMGNIYSTLKERDKCMQMLIRASISDIRSSTKETVALFWLAELLYKNGDIKNVYVYLEHALADAEFYGARQRKIQISTLLPIVAAEKLSYNEREKSRFLVFLGCVTALTLLVIWISVMLFKQLKTLKVKEKIIDDKNTQLGRVNEKLEEGLKIQEEYIGYFFNVISGYILQLEKLKRSIDMKLSARKYDEIQIAVDKINIKKERDNLFYTFDHVFIKIFPNFVEEFNALFHKEDQIWPREHELLTTDLRIFALIRMGVSDTETIAKILEYSEKTIYVYKMRIKAKAIVGGDQFEQRIMAIKAVETSNKD